MNKPVLVKITVTIFSEGAYEGETSLQLAMPLSKAMEGGKIGGNEIKQLIIEAADFYINNNEDN